MNRLVLIVVTFSLLPSCAHRHALPTRHQLMRDRLVVSSDVNLDSHEDLLQRLVELRNQMSADLNLKASDEPVYVYLFKHDEEFKAYSSSRYPQLKGRRAFFVEDSQGLSVYTGWGERVEEDLRHEVAHGYLHSVLPNASLWLDEGIAEYFEVEPDSAGLNWQHVKLLVETRAKDEWTPNLARLEQLRDAARMRQLDYAEAWLWIHFFLNTSEDRRGLLRSYLRNLQEGLRPPALSEHIGSIEPQLVEYLQFLSAE